MRTSARYREPGISASIVGPVLGALESAGIDLRALGASVEAGDEVVRGSAADRWLDLAAAARLHTTGTSPRARR